MDSTKPKGRPKKVTLTEEESNALYGIDPTVVKTFSYYVCYPNHPTAVSWKSYKDLCKQVPDVKKLSDKETIIPQLCNNVHVSNVPGTESRYKKVCFNVKNSFKEILHDYKVSLADSVEYWY
jgi:hypothetical protein